MKYAKPAVLAQNKKAGSYAAGCPANYSGYELGCHSCDRAK